MLVLPWSDTISEMSGQGGLMSLLRMTSILKLQYDPCTPQLLKVTF